MTQSNWWPGGEVTAVFVDEKLEIVRAGFHRSGFLWVCSAHQAHYVLQCLPTLDRHRVIATAGNEQLAQLICNTLEGQRKLSEYPEDIRGKAREFMNDIGLIAKEAA